MKKLTFLYLICLVFLASCTKDQDIFIADEVVISPFVTGSVGGIITDANGLPVFNTSVNLKTKEAILETQTDDNGIFYFRNVELNAERNYLYTETGAYFQGSRAFVPQKEEIEFINISLLPRVQVAPFDAATGGSFDLPENGSIVFPPNGLNDSENNAYMGMVDLAIGFLASDNPHTNLAMPGDLLAQNADGEWQTLATFGMMVFEITSNVGAVLNLADEKMVTLSVPVTSDQLAIAPSSIPLWYFDETKEHWVEEGTAQLVDDHYEGQVAHTGYWSCAISYPLVNINSDVYLSEPGMPYSNAAAKITVVGSGVCAYGYTDNKGALEVTVPASQVLLLQIFGQCEEILYEAEIGPYPTDTELGNIIVDSVNNNFVHLNGQLVDCQENAVEEGYVKVGIGEEALIFFVSDNGMFTANFDACSLSEFSITGIDLLSAKQSVLDIFQMMEVVEVGAVAVCN